MKMYRWPPLIISTIIVVLLCILTNAKAHKRGEEFSYLSMFLERDDNNSELDLDSLYRTYAKAGTKEFSRKRRKLQHKTQSAEKKKPIFVGEPSGSGAESDDDLDNDKKGKRGKNSASDSDSDDAGLNDKSNSGASGEDSKESEEAYVEDVSSSALAEKHGEDIERLAQMVGKLIKQYDAKSIIDVPCRAHAHWMPDVLSAVGTDVQFICVDPSIKVLDSVKERLEERNLTSGRNMRFVQRKFWGEGLPKGDLVVSWSGLDNMDTAHVAKYLRRLGSTNEAGKHKLVVIGTHSGELQKSGDLDKIARFTSYGTPINVRRPPFNLARPSRIIKQVATNGNDKQMYVYLQDKLFSADDE